MSDNRLEVPWPVGTQAQVELLPGALRRRLTIRRRLARLAILAAGAALTAAVVAVAQSVPRSW